MQLFEVALGSKLTELYSKPFQNEAVMHKLVEDNIEILFPGLTVLENEMAVEGYRVDTVAFNKNLNTFVVLEYKNKKDDSAMTQAQAYVNKMKKHKEKFVNKHGKTRDSSEYDWKNVYSIIIAPSFTKHIKDAAENDSTIELYTLEMYNDKIMAVTRVGGGHTRPKDTSGTDHATVSDTSQGDQ